jgi:hypothetical protein
LHGDVADVVVGQVGPDVRRAEAVGVAGGDHHLRALHRLLHGLAAVVDAGKEVGVDVDTAGGHG